MKVFIGKYTNWTGPYQIADSLMHLGVSTDTCFKIGTWLSEKTPLSTICEWIYKQKHRKVYVKIHDYDTWNMDSTLPHIILPMLIQLNKTKHGAPFTDDDDVPTGMNLRSDEAPPKEQEWDTDGNHFTRWDWVLGEIIWTFTQLHPDTDWESKYHTGEHDYNFSKIDESISELVKGPNHTHVFDKDGYTAHSARIDNGLRLFGKYYRGLWD